MKRRDFITGTAASLALATPALAQTSDPQVVSALNRYLNGIDTMQGSFVQQSSDGRLAQGMFFMRRPGRLRFEYDDPIPTVVVADGTWAAIHNRNLRTTDRLPLSRTPLYLLLREDIDLGRNGAIRQIERQPGVLRVTAIDPSNPNDGTVTMVFATRPVELRRWVITDAQGRATTITLQNVERGRYIDPNKFFIEDQQPTFGFTNDR